jgi:hypothetical protein
MAIDFKGRFDLGNDPTFRARCQSGALEAATNVMSEDDATPGHAERTAWANKVLLNPGLMSPGIAFGVAAQPGITGPEATDSDLLFTINSMVDAWAGVA